jgi:RimJ/RimL family protein N-acetyltransferase
MPQHAEPYLASGSISRNPQPTLPVGELTLRPWRESDVPAVVEAYQDAGIQRWHVQSMTDAEATAWVESWPGRWRDETGAGWAITDGTDVLGQISLRRLHLYWGGGEFSYWVRPAARGRGVAPRALQGLSSWAFGELGLHRLELIHSIQNPASCRVAEKAGFRAEGTRRGEGLHADGWHDMHLHGRLAGDPPHD